jgi:hypothetical protein
LWWCGPTWATGSHSTGLLPGSAKGLQLRRLLLTLRHQALKSRLFHTRRSRSSRNMLRQILDGLHDILPSRTYCPKAGEGFLK